MGGSFPGLVNQLGLLSFKRGDRPAYSGSTPSKRSDDRPLRLLA
jgi:hypothetical protein